MASPWIVAIRPKTLTIAVVPVIAATALAWSEAGTASWSVMLAAAVASLLIQAGTNLHNDAADFEQGADDRATRLGPARATAEGWLTPRQVRRAATLCFLLAVLTGTYLIWIGGWPILIAGLFSIGAGIAYTGGPKPIGYVGLGELFVFVFFGLVAVCGTYYLQTDALSWSAWITGALVGMPAAAVLVVNNYRDLENDRGAGKKTLAVRLGPRSTRIEYALLMLLPFVLLPLIPVLRHSGIWIALPLALIPWALYLVRRFHQEPPGPSFNHLLASTAQFQLALALLLSLSLLVSQAGPSRG